MSNIQKFASLLGSEKVLAAAEAVAKDILKRDDHAKELADAILEVNATVEGGLFQNAETVRSAVQTLLGVAGVTRRMQETVSHKNAYDYKVRCVVQTVAEALKFTTPEKPFDLDAKVDAFVKAVKVAEEGGKIGHEAVKTALVKMEKDLA